ncbi:MAG: TIGR04086 family membrane protein [Ruminococcaceae bacterium]|nr:TIGR04086 family membrane protein [Oscillospiraceae bacterium]
MADKKSSIITVLLKYSIPLISGLAVSVAAIAIFSSLMASTSLPDSTADTLVVLSASVGALLCGFLLAKARNGKGIVSGLIGGAMFFLTVFVVGALCFQESGFGVMTISIMLFSIISSTVGGILSANLLHH